MRVPSPEVVINLPCTVSLYRRTLADSVVLIYTHTDILLLYIKWLVIKVVSQMYVLKLISYAIKKNT